MLRFIFLPSVLFYIATLVAGEELPQSQRVFLPPSSEIQQSNSAEAIKLFEDAKQAANSAQASTAYRLAFQSLHADPNFEPARKLLGYVKFRESWQTPFAVQLLGAGKVWTNRFGWLPEKNVARYKRGERYYRGRWMSAEAEAKLRTDIAQGWRIQSEHYQILTNDSLEAGVELAQKLERLHAVWLQLFAGYVIDDAELKRRFEGKPPRSRGIKQHEVVYFRDRDQYNKALRPQQPKIDMTLGIYFDNERKAYFFASKDQDVGTLWHEATHQLFSESRPTVRNVGSKNNFWAIEAVACYMESMQEHLDAGYVTLGEPSAGRLPAACERLLKDNFYVPLAELVALGTKDLQADPRINKIYSQSAGLATFFLDAGDVKYREPFVAYLQAIYNGSADESTLSKLINRTYSELDAEYHSWMKSICTQAIPSAISEP
jgi:hypothetical protein